MEDLLTQLKNARRESLTRTEKESMRSNLVQMMSGSSPVINTSQVSTAPTQSPYSIPSPISFSSFSIFTRAVAFVLVGFIVGGTSLTFASNNTLPGDTLYPIKVGVSEKIKGLFAFTTEARTQLDAEHLASRFNEIEKLKNSNQLSNPRVLQIATTALVHTSKEYTESLTLLQAQGRTARANEIAHKTLASLSVYEKSKPEISMMESSFPVDDTTISFTDTRALKIQPSAEVPTTTMMMGSAPALTSNPQEINYDFSVFPKEIAETLSKTTIDVENIKIQTDASVALDKERMEIKSSTSKNQKITPTTDKSVTQQEHRLDATDTEVLPEEIKLDIAPSTNLESAVKTPKGR